MKCFAQVLVAIGVLIVNGQTCEKDQYVIPGSIKDNQIINGGFEDGYGELPWRTVFAPGSFTGWDVTNGNIDFGHYKTAGHCQTSCAAEGLAMLDICGRSAGQIAQAITLETGKEYSLRFWYSSHVGCPNGNEMRATVAITGNHKVLVSHRRTNGHDWESMDWREAWLNFTATDKESKLFVTSTTNGCGCVLFDDMKLWRRSSCVNCSNTICGKNEYRSGTCKDTTNGFKCNKCKNVICPENTYQTGACEGETNGYECKPQPLCQPGQRFTGGGVRESGTCVSCPDGYYQPASNHRLPNCVEETRCHDEYQHEVAPLTSSSDRVCDSTDVCGRDQYIVVQRTPTSNRQCKGLKNCEAGQYITNMATSSTDRECEECKDNTFTVIQNAPSCQEKALCSAGQKIIDLGTSSKNGKCGPCEQNTFMEKNEHRNLECTAQPFCSKGEYMSGLSTSTKGVCLPCPLRHYQDKASHRQPTCKPQTITYCGINRYMVNLNSKEEAQACIRCARGQVVDMAVHQEQACKDTTTTTTGTTVSATITTTTRTFVTQTFPLPPEVIAPTKGEDEQIAIDPEEVQDTISQQIAILSDIQQQRAETQQQIKELDEKISECESDCNQLKEEKKYLKKTEATLDDNENIVKESINELVGKVVATTNRTSPNTQASNTEDDSESNRKSDAIFIPIIIVLVIIVFLVILGAVAMIKKSKDAVTTATVAFENPAYLSNNNPVHDDTYETPMAGAVSSGYMDVTPAQDDGNSSGDDV
eukprot:m.155136 g.155136  ORF g.155136 m.155136 type:complete len:758 (+) comp15087_c0_seq11:182-2455(+)